MKIFKLLNVCVSLSSALLLVNNAYAVDLGDLAGAAGALQKGTQAVQTLPAGQAVAATVPGATIGSGLTGVLMQQLGVTQVQAEGGAGAVFQLAKSKMQEAAFAKLSNSVPGMQGLLAAAPVAKAVAGGGLGGMTGNLAGLAGNSGGTAGNLVGLASSFQQLGLAPDMVQKFVPIVVQYVQGNGGGAVASVLQAALMGGM